MKPSLILFLLLTVFLPDRRLMSQSEPASKIALDLFHAGGVINDQRPQVIILSGSGLPVKIDRQSMSVQLDGHALNLCMTTPDPANALATLLAPAILELYRNITAPAQQITEGALTGYMAGYTTLGSAAERLWASLYQTYPALSAVFPLDARIAHMAGARTELDRFVPSFDLANYFTLIGEYAYADHHYELIKDRFSSREIFSNSGLCKAMQALDLFGPMELNFTYPFVIDLDFRAGQKGDQEMRDSLLMAAAEDFREAIRRDPDYAIAFVNLSCTQALLKNFNEAIVNAEKAQLLARQQLLPRVEGSALIALGIALAESGDQPRSDQAFADAANIQDETVQQLLQLNQHQQGNPAGENTFFDEELIGDTGLPGLAATITFGGGMQPPFLQLPAGKLDLLIKEEPTYQLIWQHDRAENRNWFFQHTKPGFTGTSVGKIQVNADINELTDAYGRPAVVHKFGRGQFYYYKKSGIIFQINANSMVEGWTLFHDN